MQTITQSRARSGALAAAAAAYITMDRFGSAAQDAATAMMGAVRDMRRTFRKPAWKAECAAQTDLVRDIFGPLPFRDVAVAPSCKKPSVQELAQRIYEMRSFDRIGELAIAVQEAGCDDADILGHCQCTASVPGRTRAAAG